MLRSGAWRWDETGWFCGRNKFEDQPAIGLLKKRTGTSRLPPARLKQFKADAIAGDLDLFA